jgi:hypothetical protein
VLLGDYRDLDLVGGGAKKIERAARFFSSGHSSLSWNCSKCRGPGYEEGDEKRAVRNCDDESNINLGFEFDATLRRCPWSQIDAEAMMFVKWFTDWRDYKILPYGGESLLDEPAYVYDVIDFTSGVIRKIELEARKREQARLEKQLKRGRRGR